jgi:hypothetical protein
MRYVICLSILSLLLSGCSKRSTVMFNTKEELINYCIAAINNKDLASLKKVYHPQLLKMITKDNADFFNDFFTGYMDESIPAERKISYHAIEDSNIVNFSDPLFNVGFEWPVTPQFYTVIDYNKTEYSSVSKVLFLSDTKDGWFLAFPVPKQEALVKYRQAKIDKEKQAQQVAKIIDTMDPQVHAKIIEKLKHKSLMDAMSVFKETYGDDTTNAVLVVKEIRRRENLEW